MRVKVWIDKHIDEHSRENSKLQLNKEKKQIELGPGTAKKALYPGQYNMDLHPHISISCRPDTFIFFFSTALCVL